MPTYNYDSSLLTQYLRDRNLFAWNFYNRNLVQAGQSVRPEQHPPVSEEVTLNRVVGGVVPYRNGQEAFPFDLPPVAEGGVTPTPPPPVVAGGITQWVTSASGIGNIYINSVVADSLGNIYVAGIYNEVSSINSQAGVTSGTINTTAFGTLTRNSFWPYEAFIAKYDATGVAQWFTKIEAEFFNQPYVSLATDSANNVYLTGALQHNGSGVVLYNAGSAAIGSVYGTIQTAAIPANSKQSILVKYAGLDGAIQWATTIYVSDFADCITRSISVGTDDSIYVCGDFNGAQNAPYNRFITINNASSPNVSGGDVQINAFGTLIQADYANNGFVAKYNTSGQAQLATRIESTGTMPGDLTIDNIYAYSSSSVYITGKYKSNLVVNNYASVTPGSPPTINISSYGTLNQNTGQYDIFVIKFNTSLSTQWVARVGSTSNDNGPFITVDNLENIIVVGDYFNATLTIYNGASSSGGIITTPTSGFTLPNSGNSDYFIVKYNLSGVAQWVTRIAGTSVDNSTTSITHDSDNNIYVCSSYATDPVNIYNADNTSVTLVKGTGTNRCLVKYSPLGVVTWATSIGANSAGASFTRGGLVYSSGYVYLAADNSSFDSPRAALGFNDYTSTTGGAVSLTAYGTLANSSTNPNNSNSFLAKFSA